MQQAYTFAIEPSGREETRYADTSFQARRQVWGAMSDAEKDNCESVELVEERPAIERKKADDTEGGTCD